MQQPLSLPFSHCAGAVATPTPLVTGNSLSSHQIAQEPETEC
jgi:hypothetical protein